jgi:basic membrane protein A
VSSIIDDWAPYYIARTQAVMDGTWESTSTWDGIGAGMVAIGEITDAVPADVKASAEDMLARLASGEYHAFTGPINKQDGTPWLAMGETASDYGDDGLAGLNFYVEGITAEVPQ